MSDNPIEGAKGLTITIDVGTVLDRLERSQSSGFQELRQTLENKASRADVETVRRDFEHFKDHVDTRVSALEQSIHDEKIRDEAGKRYQETKKLSTHARWAVFAGALGLSSSMALAIASFIH